MKNRDLLIDAICTTYDNPDYRPRDGITFCNEAANEIATTFGCFDLGGKLANDIADFMTASDHWSEVPLERTQELANQGSLVFAVLKDTPHGHICVIRPGMTKASGRWGRVPSCMNIGKDVFISKGINWAFSELPKFYVWRDSL